MAAGEPVSDVSCGNVRPLDALHEQIQRTNQAKSEFLAAASHDLRQLVHTLMLFNCTLVASIPSDTEVAKVLAGQTQALDAMADLLGSLNDVGALDAGVMRPAVSDFPIERVFGRLRAEFELETASRGLTLVIEESDDVIRSDPHLIERIVRNLLANAIRYTAAGEVRVRCGPRGNYVRIEVCDTGVGIPAHKLQAIFDEYYQVDPRASAVSGGIGLGLAIVKRFADSLGHKLDVRSVPNQGSRFSITMPRGAPATR